MRTNSWTLRGAAALVMLLATSAVVEAQIFTPTYMPPRGVGGELGLYVSDGPGDLGIEGIWRQSGGTYDLGLRVGFADVPDGALMVGGEIRNPIQLAGAPIGLAFTAGAQGVLGGEVNGVGVQAGFSAGHTFVPGNFNVTPYLHPRLALVRPIRLSDADADFDVEVLAELGVEMEFQSNLLLRLGIDLGGESADWGLGLSWRR